jgi:hypothetical protein
MSDIFDPSSMYRLSYQLKIMTTEKNSKVLTAMIEKGFIAFIARIFVTKECYKLPEYYPILSNLMGFFNEMVKFAKLVKNPQLFP